MLNLSPLWISLRIATIATGVTFVIGTAAAYFIHRYRGRGRAWLDSLLLAPMVLPPTVLGFLLLILLGKNGPLGVLFTHVGISLVFTWYAAVITATVVALPLMYKTTLGAFEQIDGNLQQAARTLGASELAVFWRITLPLALPGLVAGTTLAFSRALGEFGATLMLAGNIPGRTQTLPMAIYFAVEAGDFRAAAIWTGVIVAVALGGLVWVNRWQPQQDQRTVPQGLMIAGELPKAISKDTSRAPYPVPTMESDPQGPQLSRPVLAVCITKKLPRFRLDVAFSTDEQPLGLLGASGAGKSLILRCIAGIETPDTGRIVLNGRVLFDSDRGINVPSCDRNVGLLFQNYALFPHLSVAQNVGFGLRHPSSGERRAMVHQQLTAVQLETLAERYPHELSGGQQQRVALARALASQPEVLLLDEPFSALDTHLRHQIEQQLIDRLHSYQGMTILVTHNLQEAYRLCHQLIVLKGGTMLAQGAKQHIFNHPRHISVAQLTGCKNISHGVALGTHQVEARHWRCHLHTLGPLPNNLTQIGIRAHHIRFIAPGQNHPPETAPTTNTFACWPATTCETPQGITLYLKLHGPPSHGKDYHLEADISQDQWIHQQAQPLPWTIYLDPRRLILLDGN